MDEDGNLDEDGEFETCGRYTQVMYKSPVEKTLMLSYRWCGPGHMLLAVEPSDVLNLKELKMLTRMLSSLCATMDLGLSFIPLSIVTMLLSNPILQWKLCQRASLCHWL